MTDLDIQASELLSDLKDKKFSTSKPIADFAVSYALHALEELGTVEPDSPPLTGDAGTQFLTDIYLLGGHRAIGKYDAKRQELIRNLRRML